MTTANGTTKPTNGVKTEVPVVTIPPSSKKIEPVTETKGKPTIQERLAKFDALSKILERREQVADALEELTNFYIPPTGTGCKLTLQDGRNNSFAISNPAVIAEIVALAKTKLQTELDNIDNQFDFNF